MSEILDIIKLIETNPITKLSNTFNNKLLKKIKSIFTNDEQKLFITSFYCYLNYNKLTDYIIDLDNIWQWLGFSYKLNAKRLLEKNFKVNVDYKQLNDINKEGRGGHNNIKYLLNIKTFKLLCLQTDTKKAREIHNYYITLEEILQDTIQEECEEFKKQVQIKEHENLQLKNNNKIEKAIEVQNVLLKKFGNSGSLVYVIKVKTYEDNTYVVKIGESRKGILNRFNEHKLNYDECLLLDCYPVKLSKDFENFIHNHQDIRINKVSNLVGHENEKELFLIGKELTYSKLNEIIVNNINLFNDINAEYEKLKLENEKYKLENENLQLLLKNNTNVNTNYIDNTIINNLLENIKHQTLLFTEMNTRFNNQLINLEKQNKELLEKLNNMQNKTTNNFNQPLTTLGPRLQKINPETLQLIKVYESIAECIKENSKLKRSSISKAVKDNTIYYGFRWMFVDRALDATIVKIEKTKQTKIQNLGYIAKLNKDKTEIINVYLDRKTASLDNGFQSSGSLDNPVKKGTLAKDHYYLLYDNCDKQLKDNFVKKHGEPILYKDGIGQYDKDNKLIKEFISKNACCMNLAISDKSLTKALKQNISYNNYYFKYLDTKDKCF